MKKVIIAFILGVAITFVGVKAAEILIPSSSVTYTYEEDGEQISTTLNEALNDLFDKVKNNSNNYTVVFGTKSVNYGSSNKVKISTPKKPLFIYLQYGDFSSSLMGNAYYRETDTVYGQYKLIQNITDDGFKIYSIWEDTTTFSYFYVLD